MMFVCFRKGRHYDPRPRFHRPKKLVGECRVCKRKVTKPSPKHGYGACLKHDHVLHPWNYDIRRDCKADVDRRINHHSKVSDRRHVRRERQNKHENQRSRNASK